MPRPPSRYQHTSLDFINGPSPVEPHASGGPPSTFSHSPATPSQVASGNLVATLLNHEPASASAIGQISPSEVDASSYTLPRPARYEAKQTHHHVPPVLQGLHQPPPNAGLLPSMNAENEKSAYTGVPQLGAPIARITKDAGSGASRLTVHVPPDALPRPARRNKWTDEETHCLLQGTRKFGVGNWKKILLCPEYSFNHRTATDLKDRFRVVSSNKEMLIHYEIYESYMKKPPDLSGESHRAAAAEESTKRHGSDGSIDLGLDIPRAKRRQRTKWSEEEDDALLRGFGRYGPSWTSIQLDPVLARRTPTDIRDRIRTRFSDDYAKAGLAPKPSKPRSQMRSQPNNSATGTTATSNTSEAAIADAVPQQPSTAAPVAADWPPPPNQPPQHYASDEQSWFPDCPMSILPAHYSSYVGTNDDKYEKHAGHWYSSQNIAATQQ